VICKDLGESHFLFTFLQPAGKRRALEEGPWMFGKDLEIVAEYDESKSIDEIEFVSIPIWVRVSKLPFGVMNKVTGEAIGNEIGSYMSMDMEEDGTTVGRYLRIKVRLDVRKPIMRGVTIFVGEPEKPLWCPMEYEFLPDFCYACGIIGHIDKMCSVVIGKDEVRQRSKKLRCFPERRRTRDFGGDRHSGNKRSLSWRPGGVDGRGSAEGSGSKSLSGRSGSDAPSWRKDVQAQEGKKDVSGKGRGSARKEEEVSSPLRVISSVGGLGEKAKRGLF
jgi:hypothetical protein